MARVWHMDNGSHRPHSFHASNGEAGKGWTWLWVGQLLWCQEAALGWLSLVDTVGYTRTECLYPWETDTKPADGETDAQTDTANILPSSMSWSSVRKRMMLGRMLRTLRSLCWRDLRRYPERYPEPSATGKIPARTSRRRRGRGAKSPRPAILKICRHFPRSSLSHTGVLVNLRNRTHTHQTWWKIADPSPSQPLLGALPCKYTHLGWSQLVNKSLMMH